MVSLDPVLGRIGLGVASEDRLFPVEAGRGWKALSLATGVNARALGGQSCVIDRV